MTDRIRTALCRALAALPFLSLFLGVTAWLRYGIDMPWFDDWRGYADGTISSLDPRYLFRPINDTMAPVGFALDALAQRHLDGNSIAYQAVSMVAVLGGLLVLQWKLLSRALANRLWASVCFAFTIFMLQPDSYWGRENLAYHQALPLVFILSALWVMVCSEASRWWHGPALLCLGLAAGFTYISGAFGASTAGLTLLLVARTCYRGQARSRLTRNALWFSAAGLVAATLQYVLAVWPMRGTHAGIPMSLPHEAQFWAFFLGKLARSLLLHGLPGGLALTLTLLVCAAAATIAVLLVRRAARVEGTEADRRLAAIFLTIAAVVFVYMLMVAAGRARFRPPEMVELMSIFAHAFTRFHFFWATLLWPWVIAGAIYLLAPRQGLTGPRLGTTALYAAGVLGLALGTTALRHMEQHRRLVSERVPLAHCLLNKLQMEGPIDCAGLVPPRFEVLAPDAYGPYAHAWNIGASFVRNFPLLPGAQRIDKLPPFYQLRRFIGKIDLEEMDYRGEYRLVITGTDPKLLVDNRQDQIMGSCQDLAIEVDVLADRAGSAKLYWLEQGATKFTEAHTQEVRVQGGEALQKLRFRIKSARGFANPIRLDPAVEPQEIEIPDFRMYCLLRSAG
jgi:hypothetical protein